MYIHHIMKLVFKKTEHPVSCFVIIPTPWVLAACGAQKRQGSEQFAAESLCHAHGAGRQQIFWPGGFFSQPPS